MIGPVAVLLGALSVLSGLTQMPFNGGAEPSSNVAASVH